MRSINKVWKRKKRKKDRNTEQQNQKGKENVQAQAKENEEKRKQYNNDKGKQKQTEQQKEEECHISGGKIPEHTRRKTIRLHGNQFINLFSQQINKYITHFSKQVTSIIFNIFLPVICLCGNLMQEIKRSNKKGIRHTHKEIETKASGSQEQLIRIQISKNHVSSLCNPIP